jgi:hypothetical protein
MVVVIGLASHGRSMDHRRGLWCRQSHAAPGTRDEALSCSGERGKGTLFGLRLLLRRRRAAEGRRTMDDGRYRNNETNDSRTHAPAKGEIRALKSSRVR